MPRRETPRRIRNRARDDVLFSRSAFCTMVGVSERQLGIWEHEELLLPARVFEATGTAQPLYDRRALERARIIRTLEQELEVNLPGIGIILHLLDRLGR